MNTIITGRNIVKTFGTGAEQVKVLDEVNAEIEKGEFVAVMGPSGSGKSTLLFALSGMDSITSGTVMFGDNELSRLSENERADVRRTRMGFVFQQPTMLKNLNLLDNIILPAMRDGKKDTAKLTQKAKAMMRKTGIVGLENRDITEVSGGQLQRAGICRALMNEPKIVFADEPTGSLNSKSSDEIMALFSKIHQSGTAILLVTHDAKVAARAQRVLFMQDGKIVSSLALSEGSSGNFAWKTEKILSEMKGLNI
ncbi:ABC transporter ATP-binding protein [Ruminococcus gauvreauii]|uniref:ABC transporter ATP-binding protein n=1 Tax=Ruminococcus gauvreauii TaxID=438033 RepID=UPI00398423A4